MRLILEAPVVSVYVDIPEGSRRAEVEALMKAGADKYSADMGVDVTDYEWKGAGPTVAPDPYVEPAADADVWCIGPDGHRWLATCCGGAIVRDDGPRPPSAHPWRGHEGGMAAGEDAIATILNTRKPGPAQGIPLRVLRDLAWVLDGCDVAVESIPLTPGGAGPVLLAVGRRNGDVVSVLAGANMAYATDAETMGVGGAP